jgi:hypothetical protein
VVHIRTTFVTYEDLSKGQFAYTIDGTTHEFKGVVEGNGIIQDDIVKTIPHVLHVLKLKYNIFFTKQLVFAKGEFQLYSTKTYLYYVKIESIAICTFQND